MPRNQETLIVVFCVIVVALCYAFMPTDDFCPHDGYRMPCVLHPIRSRQQKVACKRNSDHLDPPAKRRYSHETPAVYTPRPYHAPLPRRLRRGKRRCPGPDRTGPDRGARQSRAGPDCRGAERAYRHRRLLPGGAGIH